MSDDEPKPIGPEIDAVLARIGADCPWLATPTREVILTETATDPLRIGSALARHREQQGLTLEQQAEFLGVGVAGLAILALCRMPRHKNWERDLHNVSRWSGANPRVLAELLLPDRMGGP